MRVDEYTTFGPSPLQSRLAKVREEIALIANMDELDVISKEIADEVDLWQKAFGDIPDLTKGGTIEGGAAIIGPSMKRKYKIGFIIEAFALVNFLLLVAAFLGVWAGAMFGLGDMATLGLVTVIFAAFVWMAFSITFISQNATVEK